MINIYPSYYKKFRCIADKCPDSCCKGWDVVVDDETDTFYSTVQGEFGDKIRNLTTNDSDGDRIFISQNGRCPFWNKDMLCDIYINIGEEHLCSTCRNFPRITQDYTAFSEHILSFACPEATRLMLAESNAYANFDSYEVDFSCVDYDADLMKFLLDARKITAEILTDTSLPFAERLKECLLYNQKIQCTIDGEEAITSDNTNNSNHSFIFALHKELDTMSKEWIEILCKTDCRGKISDKHDRMFENLALYYIYRYYLTAIDSLDVLSTIKRIVCAYIVIGHILDNSNESAEKIFTLYSKEVEHSYENSEALEFEFCTNPNFSVENLICNIL